MFRAMRRIRQQISNEECIQILKEQPRGVDAIAACDKVSYCVMDQGCRKEGE